MLLASAVGGHEFRQQVAVRVDAPELAPATPAASHPCCVAVSRTGEVLVGTASGLVVGRDGGWRRVSSVPAGVVTALAADRRVLVAVGPELWAGGGEGAAFARVAGLPGDRGEIEAVALTAGSAGEEDTYWMGGDAGLWAARAGDAARRVEILAGEVSVRDLAVAADGCGLVVAAAEGAFEGDCTGGDWRRLFPRREHRSWAPVDVRAVAFAGDDLWLASPQGLARRDGGGTWSLWEGVDGLPYSDFRDLAVSPRAAGEEVWLATGRGAVHRRGEIWEYRQGRRWLPSDEIRSVAVDGDGGVWLATAAGLGRIEERSTTLAEKARTFELDIDRYHRRTPYGFVDSVSLEAPGSRAVFHQHDSDNDGLWTGMYGAGACFGYAATGRQELKERATAALRALAFLSEVPQGGSHPVDPGFVARSILPTSGPDPNLGHRERDRRLQATRDGLWKLLSPRWPISADGAWYWKTDASSDELDGHYFLYAAYYDHVAETEAEKRLVRQVVARVTDHLIEHGFALVDHDGRRTRWAVFGPEQLNHDPDWWGERGLNSVSILSYLRVAAHVTGDARYDAAARRLIDEHGYAANARYPKVHSGSGTGNQSDDEMAFMSFYNLIRYEDDPQLRGLWAHAFWRYFEMEKPERNPLFNYLYAAAVEGLGYRDAWGPVDLAPGEEAMADAVDSLERYPVDRVDWALRNSHRLDVVLLGGEGGRGSLRSGRVLPIDERFVGHWNHDPWRLDHEGEGLRLADGASFLLPYYLGLYIGALEE